ncbi:MAG: T9SS type A sorting domain-containing protein [Fibrobacteres bacterium]|nr:T9SS type A sorting domain-containing protein [Fibrobacterota bacterium]
MHFSKSSIMSILLLVSSALFSLTDTSIYKIEFLDPVDSSFIEGDTLYVNASLHNQINTLKRGADLFLTVRAVGGSGSGGSNTLVNQLEMVDDSDGTYSYKGIFIGNSSASSFEVRIRANGDGNQRIEERRVLVNDTASVTATNPWKLEILDLAPAVNGDSLIIVKAKLTSSSGDPLSGQSLSLTVLDTSNQSIAELGGSMLSIGSGIYIDTISSDLFINGRDYIFSVITANQPSLYSQRCVEIYKKTVLPPVLIPLNPSITVNLRPSLFWHSVTGAASYTIQIDTTSRFTSPMISVPLSDTSYTPLVNLPVRTIYWRVSSSVSPSLFSSVSSFTIQSDTVPQLVRFDGDTLSDRRPAFAWHAVNRATAYTIQISHTRNFSNIQISTPLSDTTYSPLINLDTSSKYFWRVSSDLNNSVYSAIDSFIIILRSTSLTTTLKSVKPALEVSPNPFTNVLSLKLSGMETAKLVKFEIYDISGKLIGVVNGRSGADGHSATWKHFEKCSAGTYIIRAISDKGYFERKVQKIQ